MDLNELLKQLSANNPGLQLADPGDLGMQIANPSAGPTDSEMMDYWSYGTKAIPGEAEANLKSVQERVDWAMQNDSQFRKDMGYSANPPGDPLAADRNGYNLPKTGKVNTLGAEQRINARAQAEGTGVTATKDKNGNLILSNLNPPVMLGNNSNPMSQTAGLDLGINNLLTQLRAAPTAAEGNVIMDNIRATVASENARLNKEAFDFATNKLDIPTLQQWLVQSEANDRASYGWFPGIGDSPGTAKIRATVQSLQGQASQQAEQYLSSSLSSGMLKSQMASAQEQFKQLEAQGTRTDRLEEQRGYLQMQKDMENDALAAQLSPEDKMNLQILNPGIRELDQSTPEGKRTMATVTKAAMKDKGRLEALKAASVGGEALLTTALEGNADAATILRVKEKEANPNMTDEIFDVKMKRIMLNAASPNLAETYVKATFANPKSEEAKAEMQRLNLMKITGDKEMMKKANIVYAIELERKAATSNFLNKADSWAPQDPLYQEAVAAARKRGVTDFDTIMNLYVGSSTGDEAGQKLWKLNEYAQNALIGQRASIFGMPDGSATKAMVARKSKDIGFSQTLARGVMHTADFINLLGDNLTPIGPIKGFMKGVQGIWNSGDVAADPATGLPLNPNAGNAISPSGQW